MRVFITGGSGFIGTNYIDYIDKNKHEIVNFDIAGPKKASHNSYWYQGEILSKNELNKAINSFKPHIIIHFAARTDIQGSKIEDYETNTIGTKNLIKAADTIDTVKRIVFTSSQFVHQNENMPSSDIDYSPYTIYGKSKMLMEKIIRSQCNKKLTWTIIRPTNIWGPWHPRYPEEFWNIVSKGFYFHPASKSVIRSYGYVENVVWQINEILKKPTEIVNKKVLYVGDKPIELLDWVNEFSRQQIGREVIKVPNLIIWSLGLLGSILQNLRIGFPITLSRYKSMTTSNPAPLYKTFNLLGAPPYSLEQGVGKTINWMRKEYPTLVRVYD